MDSFNSYSITIMEWQCYVRDLQIGAVILKHDLITVHDLIINAHLCVVWRIIPGYSPFSLLFPTLPFPSIY